jgi:hypothetical protein
VQSLSLRALAFVLVGVAFAPVAPAAKLPTATLAVQVLSVEEEFKRHEKPPSGTQTFETTGFVARAQIQTIIQSDFALDPGKNIKIHYVIRTASPLPLPLRGVPLKPGEHATLTVFRTGIDEYERR